MHPPDKIQRRIDLGCAITLAIFTAFLFLLDWFNVLPWPWALLVIVVVGLGLYAAKRRWDFDLLDVWWLWWWWW